MKKPLYLLFLAAMLVLAACGDIDAENDRHVSSKEDVAESEDVVTDKEVQEDAETVKESAIGTRSNPLPLGDTITVQDTIYDDNSNSYAASLELTVLETIRGEEAWEIILNENQFNEPAQEGFEYALVKVKGFLKEAETENDSFYFSDMNFDFVSNDGEVYDMFSVVIPNELSKELYSGATGEGYLVNQVKIDDDFKVSYESSEGSPVFFFVK